jgi:hypothetical protein
MEGLEAGRPVVIYGKTANRSEVARLMLADLPIRDGSGAGMPSGSEG